LLKSTEVPTLHLKFQVLELFTSQKYAMCKGDKFYCCYCVLFVFLSYKWNHLKIWNFWVS